MGSPIRKSTDIADICSSPWLIAACHVLRRLLMPRHSPCALSSLTYLRSLVLNSELCRQSFGSFSYEIVTLTFRCFHNLSSKPSIALLSLFFSLFSFQGTAFRLLLKPDQNIQSLEYFDPSSLVEIVGIEPATSCLQGRRSPS